MQSLMSVLCVVEFAWKVREGWRPESSIRATSGTSWGVNIAVKDRPWPLALAASAGKRLAYEGKVCMFKNSCRSI